MRKIILLLLALSGFVLLSGCKKDSRKDEAADTEEVQIRVRNATPYVFYNCMVNTGGTVAGNPAASAYNYGQVAADSASVYQTFSLAYRYARISLTMSNKPYQIIPYDYTGEQPLSKGKYTYKITYAAGNDAIAIELIKD